MSVSARELAKALDVSHTAVNKAARRGRIQRGPDGRFDLEKAVLAWDANADTMQKLRGVSSSSVEGPAAVVAASEEAPTGNPVADLVPTLSEALRQKEWARVEMQHLELARRRGELIELAPINAFVAGMILRAREELLHIAPELRDRLAQETNPVECERMVSDRIRHALAGLAEYRPQQQQSAA
jgi:hypothetical protein